MIGWLFRNRKTGRITIAQWPNIPLGLFIAARVVDAIAQPSGTVATVLDVVGTGALLVWAVDEIVRGVNPWRRILGAVTAVFTVFGLFR